MPVGVLDVDDDVEGEDGSGEREAENAAEHQGQRRQGLGDEPRYRNERYDERDEGE